MDTIAFLRQEEDCKKTVYNDSLGYATIAVGICVDPRVPGAGLRDEEINFITNNRVNIAKQELARQFSWFFGLDEVRKTVVVSMHWQVGNLELWPKFCNAMAVRDYAAAAKEMLDSKVARVQAPKRWQLQARMMRTGEWS